MKKVCCFLLLLCSCNKFNPEEYRIVVEDCLRYEISWRSYIDEIKEHEKYSQVVSKYLDSRYPEFMHNASDYKQLLNHICQAKETHHYSTYYETLLFLRVGISDYESSTSKAKEYQSIINDLIIKYNNTELSLSSFKKISSRSYVIMDNNSGSICTMKKGKGNDIVINVIINK